jgi:hypothetical protein
MKTNMNFSKTYESPDMSLCPLCGQSNNCAMEKEKLTQQKQDPCWCVSVEFPKQLLAQLPKDALGCICNKCVAKATQ